MQRIRNGRSAQLGVVDQVVRAFHQRNLLATALGFIIGGVVPAATYLEAHHDLNTTLPLYAQAPTYLILGGLLFSAKTVFAWGALAFRDRWKAAGFVVLLEGVMITSHVPLLPLGLLIILVAINGIATGCTLSLDRMGAAPPRRALSSAVAAAPSERSEPVVPVRRGRMHRELAVASTHAQGDLFAA